MYKYICLKNGEIIETESKINSPFFSLVDSRKKSLVDSKKAAVLPPSTKKPPKKPPKEKKESQENVIEEDFFKESPNDFFDEPEKIEAPEEDIPEEKPKKRKRK